MKRILDPETIAAAYRAGNTMDQIAAAHGVCRAAVWQVLNRAGVPSRPRQARTVRQDVRDRIMSLRLSGRSAAAVAREHGLHPSTVRRVWSATAHALGMGGGRR